MSSKEEFQTNAQQNNVHQNQLPFFGAFQTESIRCNIRDMQETFGKSLSRLRAMGRSVLHVKATNWHTEYALFKEQVKRHLHSNEQSFPFGWLESFSMLQQ